MQSRVENSQQTNYPLIFLPDTKNHWIVMTKVYKHYINNHLPMKHSPNTPKLKILTFDKFQGGFIENLTSRILLTVSIPPTPTNMSSLT